MHTIRSSQTSAMRAGLAVLATLAASPASARGQSVVDVDPDDHVSVYQLIEVVRSGQVLPGTGGAVLPADPTRFGWAFFEDSAQIPYADMNDRGDVVFRADQLEGGTANAGVFLATQGRIEPIAVEGEAVPEASLEPGDAARGGRYEYFSNVGISDDGTVVFAAQATGSRVG